MAEAAAPQRTALDRFTDVLIDGVSKAIDHSLDDGDRVSSGQVFTQSPNGAGPGNTQVAGQSTNPQTIITGVNDKTVYLVGGLMLALLLGGMVIARRR